MASQQPPFRLLYVLPLTELETANQGCLECLALNTDDMKQHEPETRRGVQTSNFPYGEPGSFQYVDEMAHFKISISGDTNIEVLTFMLQLLQPAKFYVIWALLPGIDATELDTFWLNAVHFCLWLASLKMPMRSLQDSIILCPQISSIDETDFHIEWHALKIYVTLLPKFLLCHSV